MAARWIERRNQRMVDARARRRARLLAIMHRRAGAQTSAPRRRRQPRRTAAQMHAVRAHLPRQTNGFAGDKQPQPPGAADAFEPDREHPPRGW